VDGTPAFVIGQKIVGGFIEGDILAAVKAEAARPSATKGTGQ
jgi:hypothetical protein